MEAVNSIITRLEGEDFDAFEVCFIEEDKISVEARDGEVESLRRSKISGVGLRAVRNQRVGCVSTTDLSSKTLIRELMDSIQNSPESEFQIISNPPSKPYPVLDEKKGRSFCDIPESKKIEAARKLEKIAVNINPKVSRVKHAVYEEYTRRIFLYNSCGIRKDAERQIASCRLFLVAENGADKESGWDFSFSPRFEDLDIEGTAKRASDMAVSSLGAKGVATGSYNVVFDGRAFAQLMRFFAPSFFADNVRLKRSALSGKKGELHYNPLVTIYDDGIMADGFASFVFDDEGVAKQKTTVVLNGVIKNWLYDTKNARRDKCASTGNCGRSSIHKEPEISAGNFYIGQGDKDLNELLSAAGNGIFITDLMGVHTANSVTGDFSLGASGYRINVGKKREPVRGIIAAGNIHEILGRVEAIGNDLQFLANYGSASILVPKVNISG